MSSDPKISSTARSLEPTAPWWHTAFVLLVLGAGSVTSAYEHGFPNLHLPGMSLRLSGYATVLLEEWLLVLSIWLWLKSRGSWITVLTGGRWHDLRAFWKDVGWGLGFLLVGIPLTSALSLLTRTKLDAALFLPHSATELLVWLLLAATAGFAEELIFRGYLQRQFAGWTNSPAAGIALQGLVFGLAHGYQGMTMIVIVIYGCLFGTFVAWRKSLLPAMLAHGLQDAAGGLLFFLSTK
jgi:membrane protease YdiL (CAAX protease family)